jgi:hypothetical protein
MELTARGSSAGQNRTRTIAAIRDCLMLFFGKIAVDAPRVPRDAPSLSRRMFFSGNRSRFSGTVR